ncbi:MAG: discoidin domain-containing protein [Chloroflexi bacterium]|nr:discoidin domain-containing protein [Chloroflexota bacterium]
MKHHLESLPGRAQPEFSVVQQFKSRNPLGRILALCALVTPTVAALLLSESAQAQDLIRPTIQSFSSELTACCNRKAAYLVDGSGLTAGPSGILGAADSTQGNTPDGSMYLSEQPDTSPTITFNLGGTYDLKATRIWNYNEGGPFPIYGAKAIEVSVSADNVTFTAVATITPKQADGTVAQLAQDFPTAATGVRYVRLQLLDHFGGDRIGLSEVRFEGVATTLLVAPTLESCYSELTQSCNPKSRFLVDGSGLTAGPSGILGAFDSTDGNAPDGRMYLSELSDASPTITFNLGGIYDLKVTRIWNYNEGGPFTVYGARDVEVSVSADNVTFTPLTTITLERTGGSPAEPAEEFATPALGVQYVRLHLLANAERIGLSEVRFEVDALTAPPTITGQPQNQTVALGGTATFTVTATGPTPLNYQWRKGDANLSNGANIAGATSNTLTVRGVALADEGGYTVVVSNANGSAISSTAFLSTVPLPKASIALHAGILFEGIAGVHYRAEYREALDPTDAWKLLQDIPALLSTPFRVYDPAPAVHPQRYYRVVVAP